MMKSSMNQIEPNDVNDDPEVSRVERSSGSLLVMRCLARERRAGLCLLNTTSGRIHDEVHREPAARRFGRTAARAVGPENL